MGKPVSRSATLAALTGAALGLPGIAKGQAADAARGDYRYSTYREADLPAGKVDGPDGQRYEIQTHQFRLAAPLGGPFDGALDLAYESMSGASPWYVIPGPDGRPVQVMSGATIEERRADALVQLARRDGSLRTGVQAGYSDEDDYRAANLGVDAQYELADTVTTVSGGLGYSDDRLEPTQGTTPTSVTRATRDSLTAFAGVARVLNADTVLQTSLSFTEQGGFLSDPYKAVFITGAGLAPDRRPERRRQWAWLTRLRHFVARAGAALHLDYRLYDDDWDIAAHTVDLAWHQNLPAGVQLVPALRWYSQSQAYFHQPFFDTARADGLASSDYRLSGYGALSPSLAGHVELGGWRLNLRYERYDSSRDYAHDAGADNPGLVDFQLWSLGLTRNF